VASVCCGDCEARAPRGRSGLCRGSGVAGDLHRVDVLLPGAVLGAEANDLPGEAPLLDRDLYVRGEAAVLRRDRVRVLHGVLLRPEQRVGSLRAEQVQKITPD